MSDEILRDRLLDLDNSDEDLNSWECEFIESVGYDWEGPYTTNQRNKIVEMLEKYGY
jgi:hypothetical protein